MAGDKNFSQSSIQYNSKSECLLTIGIEVIILYDCTRDLVTIFPNNVFYHRQEYRIIESYYIIQAIPVIVTAKYSTSFGSLISQ